jgi:hypothetical protein
MISDDDLILYHYRDGLEAAERARIGKVLSEQPELAHRLQGLVARLDAAAAMPEVPVPAHTLERWQAALAQAANKDEVVAKRATRAPRGFFADLRWQAAAAAVAAVALTFIVQVVMRTPPEQTAEIAPPAPADAAAYERGLKFHLASTEQQLAELGTATPEERKRLIETIAAQNRMYALAAERAGEPQLARVLRAFAPILESLEQGGGDASASIAQLSFEMRVMQGRLSASAGSPSNQSTTL